MNKKLQVEKNDILTAFKILEKLRGDLDRIGALGARQGEEAMKDALKNYFTPEIYRKIVCASSALGKYISENTYIALMRSDKPYNFKTEK